MSTSQIFAAVDGLYAIAVEALASANTCDVYDGPIDKTPGRDYLLIGSDQPRNTDGNPIVAVDSASDWAALGQLRRDETFSIHCVYVAFGGDPSLTTLRGRAGANIGLVETALRLPGSAPGTNFSLGGAINNPGWIAVVITRVDQVKPGNGAEAHVHFDVVCRGRI